jgi:glycerol-3-phosphate O-acyltransferase/dihydroxyacetone phosphate acyltransferase
VADLWWALTRGLARFTIVSYYRSYRLEHGERIPRDGPILFVLNHPNSLLDPAALMLASPRPVHFAAKGPLFRLPVLGSILRRIGAVPIDRPQDAGSDVRRNVTSAFTRMVEILGKGGSCAIFPEGISHTDPELKTVKSGPARIALEAEESAGWNMGLRVVPVGLTFHPRQVFRGDVVVRVGEPFRVDDLKGEHRHAAIRAVQERIATALKPLIHQVDRLELAPLVDAIADLYGEDRKWTGRSGQPLPREEVVRAAQTCLNHNIVADPEAVEDVRRRLHQLERLSGRSGIPLEAARIRGSPVSAFLAFAGRGLLLVAGFPVYAWGLLTGFIPYRATDRFARALAAKSGGPTALPLSRVIFGLICFGLWWGALTYLYWRWSASALLAAIFAGSLVLGGLLARAYWLRARALLEGLEALLPFFARRRALARVAEARAELLAVVAELARRTEAALGQPLVPPGRRRRLFPWGKVSAIVLVGLAAWFLAGLKGQEIRELAAAPSPWKDLAAADARSVLDRDARVLVSHLETLEGLSARMEGIRADIDGGKRNFYDPDVDREIRGAMLSYLTCREGLLKIAWYYKEPGRPERDLELRASLAAYASAVELCARGMQLVDAFRGHPDAVRKLNEADLLAEVPAGTYDRVRRNLADSDLLEALAAAEARFRLDREAGPLPPEEPWPRIAARAEGGAKIVSALSDRLWTYKWENAVTRAIKTGGEGRYRASSVVSSWIGDARVRTRAGGGGLVSKSQVEEFRAKLRPGDILVERRNWYLSNAFLPGFWKHAAIYLGGTEGVRSLGLAEDPALAKAVALLGKPDHDGHAREVIEAISEGVLLTSLEESIGGADAVCAFRARVPPEAVKAAVRRALLQAGKPYDFDFDFFSTDRLVCTEVVYQAYQESVRFELVEIMGRRTLPALEIVKVWEKGRGKPDALLDFVAFLDGDEAAGTAREAGEEELVASIGRPSLTPLQSGASGRPLFLSPWLAATVAMTLAGMVVFRRRPAPGPL